MFRFTLKKLKIIPVMTAAEALRDVKDGASIACGGFGLTGVAFELLEQLNKNKTKDLTVTMVTMGGPDYGTGPLARDGQLKKIITTYVGENKVISSYLQKGEFEAEFNPMATLIDRLNAAGSGMGAFYTPTGYGTDVAEGRLPVRWASDGSGLPVKFSQPKETRLINGRWCVYETPLPHDFAFVRAWKADTRGNLIFRGTARNFNLIVARCAKTCIVEAEEVVEYGELDPNQIHLPGVYVDRLVKPDKPFKSADYIITRNPDGSSGAKGGKVADPARNIIARRAVLEIKDGMNINLGVGVPNLVSNYIPKELDVMLQSENGLLGIGPHPLPEEVDFDYQNAGRQTVTMAKGAALFDSTESFAMIRGGHMDLTMLGALEVSSTADLASWYIPGKVLTGMGGAMDLITGCPRSIVLMEHTNKEGKTRVVDHCHIPLTAKGKVNTLITNLALFEFVSTPGGMIKMILKELAPGVTLEELKSKTEARFEVSPDLKEMPLAPPLF